MNWNLTYNGLSRVPFFAQHVKQLSIKHGYNSTLEVNRFNTEPYFQEGGNVINEQTDNFYSRLEIPTIVIQEDLSPLIGVNMTLNNGMQLGVDYAKSRNLQLNFLSDNKQVIESNSTTVNVTFGYLMKEVSIGFLGGKKSKVKNKKKSQRGDSALGLDELSDTELGEMFDFSVVDEKTGDLNVSVDVSLRDEITKNFLIDKNTNQVTRGSKVLSIAPSADYSLNKKVNFRLFFEYNSTTPYTTQQFRRVNTRGGVTLRFALN
jgi:cell surface protein SprA